MKITDIVAVLHKTATDMQAFVPRNDDLNLPDEVVLPFIMNFLTDERLRKLSAEHWLKRLEPLLAVPPNRCGCHFHPLDWIDRLSRMA